MMAEIVTKEEFKQTLAQLFPSEIMGFQRPDEPIPTNIEFDTEMPQWIRKDPAFFATLNAFFCRCLSNDERCREWINECMEALEKQDFNLATQTIKGMMSAPDKKKLDGVAAGAEVNQNTFSNIKTGAQTVAATKKTDTVELTAGGNIEITAKGKVITIDTKNIADGAEVNQNAFAAVQVGTEKINAGAKSDTLQIAAGKNISVLTDAKTKKITIQIDGELGINLRKSGTEYAVGDIAYSPLLPSWARLECVVAGTTASGELQIPQNVNGGGALISDGTAVFIVDDIRELSTVGDVVAKLYLPSGYVKANGATVSRADYPRLVALANKYNLWTNAPGTYPALFGVGNGSTTFTLPDWRGVVIRFLDEGRGLDAGRVLGSYQADMVLSHAHGATAWTDTQGNHQHGVLEYAGYGNVAVHIRSGGDANSAGGITGIAGAHGHNVGVSVTAAGGAESRMKNIAVLAVIRY